ncbi:MAG: PAS domain S-box protein [Methanoregula sp.]|uniref:PAS domain-containing protein n=1 Tax=Methanoregula sp. TaxID=2052170 RepID=UPI003C33A7CA
MAVIDQERVNRIKQVLKWNPRGMTISDLTKKMQINRNLIAKNLDMLVISGQVEMQPVGAAKVYFLSQRVPVASMLEFSSDLVIMIDRDERIIFVNEQVPTLLDVQRETLIGNRIDTINNPFLRDLCRSVPDPDPNDRTGNEHVAEMSSLVGSGHRHFRIKKVPTTFEDGSHGFTFIIEDITAQKTYHQMLEISEARYRGLVMSSGEAIIGSAPDGRITSWNPAAERLFGYGEAEIVGNPFSQLVPQKTRGDLDRLLHDIRQGDCIQRREMQMMRRDDHEIDAKITICPIRDENGIITGTSSIIQDITYEKLEMHAREYEERYHTLFEDMNVGVYRSTGDPRGRFVWGNTALLQILGYGSMEDLREINVTDVFSEPDGRMQLLDELRRNGFVKNRVLSLKRTDDTPVKVSVTALAEFNENKDLVFINGIVQDVSGSVTPGTDRAGPSAGNG